jgi:glycosidase
MFEVMKKQFYRFLSGTMLGLGLLLWPHSAGAQMPIKAQSAPEWVRDGIVYEIFPRDFSKEGNFNGITARLDDLHKLGVTTLWLMPIHPIGQKERKGSYGSPYAVRDYYAVNPDYGTKDDLKRLVIEAHQRQMKVILDMVLLHTAPDNVLMAHPDFYLHDSRGNIIPPVPEWTDVAGLNYQNPALRQYLIEMLEYWVTSFNVDGFRCDTASMVPTSFWEEARAALVKVKPDIMLLAEADKPELLTNAFCIDYAWPMLNTIRNVLGHSAPAYEIQQTWKNDRKRYPQGALRLVMSDNHDQARAVSCFGVSGALAASVLTFTIDGVPLLYNGMEAGDATESGDPALFEKVPVFWHPKGRPQLLSIYHDLIQLRRQYPAFRTSNVEWVSNSDEKDLVTFVRSDEKDEFLVMINFSNRPIDANVNLKNPTGYELVQMAGMENSDESPAAKLHLKGFGWRIYHRAGTLASQ